MKLATKVKLLANESEKEQLTQVMIATNRASNWVAEVAFEHKTFGQVQLHKLVYYQIKQRFNLSSQLAIRAIGRVVDVYKNKKQRSKIIKFGDLSTIDYDTRNLSIKKDNEISITTLGKRIKLQYRSRKPLETYELCTQSELSYDKVKGKFYVNFFRIENEKANDEVKSFVGVDLGIVNLATCSDGEVVSGERVENYRNKITSHKARLQSKGSRSAKRRLKKISRKESRFKKDTNHCISKKLVQKAKALKVGLKLEDLDFKKQVPQKGWTKEWKDNNAKRGKWAFGQLRAMIDYKAKLLGVPVLYINPAYTSQKCSKCGHTHEDNRLTQSEFKCISCGYSENADLNAAINISRAELFQSSKPKRAEINQPIVAACKGKLQTAKSLV